MHTPHRPPPSPIAKIMLEVPLKIHLHINCYYFPRRKNFKEKKCIFLHPNIWEWGRRVVLLFQKEDGDRQRYCAKYTLLFLQKNVIFLYIWCHFAKKKKINHAFLKDWQHGRQETEQLKKTALSVHRNVGTETPLFLSYISLAFWLATSLVLRRGRCRQVLSSSVFSLFGEGYRGITSHASRYMEKETAVDQ